MSLTVGTAPFGSSPAGQFNFSPPQHTVYVEEFPRRVRGIKDGRPVVDSARVRLVHETNRLPRYSFPAGDVQLHAQPDPLVDGYVLVRWEDVDAWYEEDEQILGHVHDPYHRIEVYRTSRLLRVSLEGTVLAESGRAKALYETGLPVRWYLPRDDVHTDLLAHSDTETLCAYKGYATHFSARLGDRLVPDVAWSYQDPWHDATEVRGHLAFYNERVDLDIDGVRHDRPSTPWSR
jgi:uncharacterized protein (DUF427 family)